jgi:hypothetical protein
MVEAIGFSVTAIGGPAGASTRNVNQFNGSAAIIPTKRRPRPAIPDRVRSPPVSEFLRPSFRREFGSGDTLGIPNTAA